MLLGTLTRDPEIKYTPKGTAVCELGMALNSTRKNESGEKVTETTFVDVTLWGRTAEVAAEYAKKGQLIFVEGALKTDSWEDKQSGQKRTKLKVNGENIQLLGDRNKSQASRPPSEPEDRDIPF